MKIIKTKFKDLLIYKKPTFEDKRGFFREMFIKKHINKDFVFDIMSSSRKNVLRGLHIQTKKPQGKLITVIRGKIFDVGVDCRKNSKTYGKYFSKILSEKENVSLYIPEGFAHGFLALEKSIIHYKCTQYRDKKSETGINWNDHDLKIKWPKKNYIISDKDKSNIDFKDFSKIII